MKNCRSTNLALPFNDYKELQIDRDGGGGGGVYGNISSMDIGSGKCMENCV